jgi:two-component system, OmpR family, sensor histidine kinase TctE
MNWPVLSLRRRLLLWLMVPLLSVSAFMLLEVRVSAIQSANKVYDRVLLGSALAIAERVILENDEIEVDVPYVALEMLVSAAQDRVFYQVRGANDRFITGYEDLPDKKTKRLQSVNNPVFYDAVYRGEKIRVVSLRKLLGNQNLAVGYQVKVAETIRAREALADEILVGSVVRLLLLISLAALITWIGVGRGLAPLVRLEEALNRRSPTELREIKHQVPLEVQHLVDAINSLLDRLGTALDAQHRFTGNVAHQLRTPIAAIRTHIELLLRDETSLKNREVLQQLLSTCTETTHLINQLLSLASAAQPETTQRMDTSLQIHKIAADICKSLVPKALEAGIDLGFEDLLAEQDRNLCIKGDLALVEEALRNLINNAIYHCPVQTQVTVRLIKQDHRLLLQVSDNGPGVPQKELTKLTQRFYQYKGEVTNEVLAGSGLGLAIVREIADRHNAHLSLAPNPEDAPGLTVTISFPIFTS